MDRLTNPAFTDVYGTSPTGAVLVRPPGAARTWPTISPPYSTASSPSS